MNDLDLVTSCLLLTPLHSSFPPRGAQVTVMNTVRVTSSIEESGTITTGEVRCDRRGPNTDSRHHSAAYLSQAGSGSLRYKRLTRPWYLMNCGPLDTLIFQTQEEEMKGKKNSRRADRHTGHLFTRHSCGAGGLGANSASLTSPPVTLSSCFASLH